MAKKISIVLLLLIFTFMAFGKSSSALWGDSQKESKLDKDSYEKLVKKNLELRNEVETLAKEQERLRGIYKILLEKVKTLQKENDILTKQLEAAGSGFLKKNEPGAEEPVAEPYTEPSPDMGGGRAEGMKEGISVGKEIIEKQAKKIKDQEYEIAELENELGRLKNVFDKAALKKKFPEAFAGKDEADKFKNSSAAKRVKEEVEKIEAGQALRKNELKALDKEMEGLRVNIEDLRGKIKSMDNKVIELNNSTAREASEARKVSEQSSSGQDRIKPLERSLDAALAVERDLESKLQDAGAKIGRIKEAIEKAGAGLPPKNSPPDYKNPEVVSLEKDLEKIFADERAFKEKVQETESKVEDLRAAIDETRASSEESASRAAAIKDNVKAMEKEIAYNEAAGSAVKKDLQHLAKNMSGLKDKRDKLARIIGSDEKKARDLKKIIEKKMVEISSVWESQPGDNGLASSARTALSMLSNQIGTLKAKNEELAKEVKRMKASGNKKLKENELPPEIKARLNKERLDMHYNLAVVYDKNGMYKDAEREYIKCLAIDPNDADVHYNLGILYDDKMNLNHKAETHYKKFLALRPMGDNATLVRVWLTGIELEKRLGKETR